MLLPFGCRDDRPLVDSGSVVLSCTVDYATSATTDKFMSFQHYGIKRNYPFTNRADSAMCVNFEVTNTTHNSFWSQ